ncbi:MAG: 30S ribosomal protein S12 methylthiotransferase RimO [Proteobacteria bacterium]|nr:30S ribosomal protein S12 methylthiotransferase RimO [Pseudomonadota bacterium]
MKSVHLVSLGCPKNLVDSEVMLGALLRAGFGITEDASRADVIIVNTCAFIEDAKREAIDAILEMARFKSEGKARLLVVAGCLPQRYEEEIEDLFPEVDIFVGAGEFHRIADILVAWEGRRSIHVARPEFLYDHGSPRIQATPPHTAYIKIAEGCFHPCSFCIIPSIRGGFRSREPQSVVEEGRQLIARGVRELNLIAQDTTGYGRGKGSDIASLVEGLAGISGEKWIRIMYAYPHDFPMRLIDVMRDHRDVCRYLDIPIQHISDRILKSMRRKGDAAEIRGLILRLRAEIPEIALRTSLIVGYPGETEAEFEELCAFVREARFEHLGAFAFSPEEGTAAAKLKGRVPADVAEERRRLIMELQQRVAREKNAALVGKRMKVLVEGLSEESEHLIQARHEGQAPDIDGVVYINEGNPKVGEFAEVEITDSHDYDLVGRVL